MIISTMSIFVDDQQRALDFYTGPLGFVPQQDIPICGPYRWLTVSSPEHPDGVQISFEPAEHPAVAPFREALVADGIPFTSFTVADVDAEYQRLRDLGVVFTQEPLQQGPLTTAVLDDTCGNLIQLAAMEEG